MLRVKRSAGVESDTHLQDNRDRVLGLVGPLGHRDLGEAL
eukprot:COSAG01_NODE_37675_length_500_cov_1.022444_1_plen_39_part_10